MWLLWVETVIKVENNIVTSTSVWRMAMLTWPSILLLLHTHTQREEPNPGGHFASPAAERLSNYTRREKEGASKWVRGEKKTKEESEQSPRRHWLCWKRAGGKWKSNGRNLWNVVLAQGDWAGRKGAQDMKGRDGGGGIVVKRKGLPEAYHSVPDSSGHRAWPEGLTAHFWQALAMERAERRGPRPLVQSRKHTHTSSTATGVICTTLVHSSLSQLRWWHFNVSYLGSKYIQGELNGLNHIQHICIVMIKLFEWVVE